jgi:hypothetical protein
MNGKQSKRLRLRATTNITNENLQKASVRKVEMRLLDPLMKPVAVMRHTYSHAQGTFRSNLKEEKRRFYGRV